MLVVTSGWCHSWIVFDIANMLVSATAGGMGCAAVKDKAISAIRTELRWLVCGCLVQV